METLGEAQNRGKVYFIGAGPGDPDLITVRGRALIERCPLCLFAGSLVPRAVVAYAPAHAVVRNSVSMHLDQIIELMAETCLAGNDVARVHSGDPSIYGAIAEQMRRLDGLNIAHEIVPGVSSFQAAASELGIEWTPAGLNQTIIITRAPGRTGLPENEKLEELAKHRVGMALFLSAAQMPEVVDALQPHYGENAPVVVAHRVTWPDQAIFRTTLAEVAKVMADAEITMTALVLIGPMLGELPPQDSHLYSKTYSHTYRKARDDA